MAALAAAFPEPKPALAFGSGRLLARLEVEGDHELEAARLAADRFAKAMEKAILELLPRIERLEKTTTPRAEEREQRTLSIASVTPSRVVLLSPAGRWRARQLGRPATRSWTSFRVIQGASETRNALRRPVMAFLPGHHPSSIAQVGVGSDRPRDGATAEITDPGRGREVHLGSPDVRPPGVTAATLPPKEHR